MIKEIKNLFNHRMLFDTIKIESSINILFGGNGVGKSSFLEAIATNKAKIESNANYEIMFYKNSTDNAKSNKMKELGTTSDFVKAINSIHYSEGQASIHHILSFLEDVKDKTKKDNNIVMLMDEIDSGLSVENINMLMWLINELIDTGKVQTYIATNHYHWIYVYKNVINLYTGKYLKIDTYEEYFNLLNEGIQIMANSGKREFNFLDVY